MFSLSIGDTQIYQEKNLNVITIMEIRANMSKVITDFINGTDRL